MSQEKKPNVLLVEADTSLRRLLTLGLQQHGMHVIEASSPTHIPFLDVQELDLLVLDVDNGINRYWSLLEDAQSYSDLSTVPAVVLAWECLPIGNTSVTTGMPSQIACLTKPFDARNLYQAVEQLLSISATNRVASETRAEEILLDAYSVHAAPSIWPITTAAGLLLIVMGLLLHIALTVVGLLIVVVALLLWTLGAKSQQSYQAKSELSLQSVTPA